MRSERPWTAAGNGHWASPREGVVIFSFLGQLTCRRRSDTSAHDCLIKNFCDGALEHYLSSFGQTTQSRLSSHFRRLLYFFFYGVDDYIFNIVISFVYEVSVVGRRRRFSLPSWGKKNCLDLML